MALPSPRRTTIALAGLLGTLGATVLSTEAALATPAYGTATSSPPTPWTAGALGGQPIGVKMSNLDRYSTSRLGIETTGRADDRLMAYCIELKTGARIGTRMKQTSWSGYPGSNAVDDNMTKINWIVNHSVVTVGQHSMESRINEWLAATGQPALTRGLQAQEAISGTQAAIWHYSDRGTLAAVRSPDSASTSYGAVADTRKVYDYLVRHATATSAGAVARGMSVTPGELSGAAGALIGPMTVKTTGSKVRLTAGLPDSVELVDAAGSPVDTDNLGNDQKIYLRTPADAPAGSATLRFTSDDAVLVPAGQMYVGHGTRTQSFVTGSHQRGPASDSVLVRWTAAPPANPNPPPAAGGEQPTPAGPTPAITTSATDAADGDKLVDAAGGKVVDVVTYSGLAPETEYTLTGELMDKATGAATGVKATKTFTTAKAGGQATTVDGTVEVVFTVPKAHAGKQLVAFETLTLDGTVVASHADIDDLAQTVGMGVEVAGTPVTPAPAPAGTEDRDDSGPSLPVTGASLGALVGAGVLGLAVGGTLLVTSRKRRSATRL